jgi:hypothetical protein
MYAVRPQTPARPEMRYRRPASRTPHDPDHVPQNRPMSQDKADNTPPPSKLTVTWDDLQTRKVEQRLKEQDALARNRVYAAMDESTVAPPMTHSGGVVSVWRNTIFALALFGLIGGLLAWGCGTLLEFKADLQANAAERLDGLRNLADNYEKDLDALKSGPAALGRSEADSNFAVDQAILVGREENAYFATAVPREQARIRMRQLNAIDAAKKANALPADKAAAARARIVAFEQGNPYFSVMSDASITPAQQDEILKGMDAARDAELRKVAAQDQTKALVANILAFGVRGVIIAVLLAIAVPLTENNLQAVLVNGSVGAALGLLGGVVAAFVTSGIEKAAAGAPPDSAHQYLTTVAVWAAMGVFLTVAPGIVMRNGKKLIIGLLGGLIGGLIGGVLYEPIKGWELFDRSPRFPELVAMVAIGLMAGLATGLIEDVAKAGWVKVAQGLIAGKQFILYRNPTFIGAGPDCQIYLFKDPKVGRRHAAIHIVPGGYELEDLPLGTDTLLNGKPAKRARLKNGDRIQIGSTQLVFMEKAQAAT